MRRSRPSMNGAVSWSGTTVTDGLTTSSAAGVSRSAFQSRGSGPFCFCWFISIGVCEKRLRLSRIVCESVKWKRVEDGDWGSANWWNLCAALRQEPSSSGVVVSKVSSMHYSKQLLNEIGFRDVNGFSNGIFLRKPIFSIEFCSLPTYFTHF